MRTETTSFGKEKMTMQMVPETPMGADLLAQWKTSEHDYAINVFCDEQMVGNGTYFAIIYTTPAQAGAHALDTDTGTPFSQVDANEKLFADAVENSIGGTTNGALLNAGRMDIDLFSTKGVRDSALVKLKALPWLAEAQFGFVLVEITSEELVAA